jgi:hypothetical protein
MNQDFSNSSKQSNNYYKYNNHVSGYGMANQFNPQLQNQQTGGQQSNYMNMNNPYGGYLPEQYQNVYFNPYAGYQAPGVGLGISGGLSSQNAYPYNYNYQGQQQPNQIFDQNANSQYQQMLSNTLSGNQIIPQSGTNVNIPQTQSLNQDQYQVDLNNQYLQQIQMGGYMVPGYDFNQMNMIQLVPQDHIQSQNDNNQTVEKRSDGEIDN